MAKKSPVSENLLPGIFTDSPVDADSTGAMKTRPCPTKTRIDLGGPSGSSTVQDLMNDPFTLIFVQESPFGLPGSLSFDAESPPGLTNGSILVSADGDPSQPFRQITSLPGSRDLSSSADSWMTVWVKAEPGNQAMSARLEMVGSSAFTASQPVPSVGFPFQLLEFRLPTTGVDLANITDVRVHLDLDNQTGGGPTKWRVKLGELRSQFIPDKLVDTPTDSRRQTSMQIDSQGPGLVRVSSSRTPTGEYRMVPGSPFQVRSGLQQIRLSQVGVFENLRIEQEDRQGSGPKMTIHVQSA